MSACWALTPRTPYSQGMTHLTVGGLHLMPHPTRRRAPRRVVLESIPRRDAAQRLSLAFTLLARGQGAQALAPSAVDAAERSTGAPPPAPIHEEGTR